MTTSQRGFVVLLLLIIIAILLIGGGTYLYNNTTNTGQSSNGDVNTKVVPTEQSLTPIATVTKGPSDITESDNGKVFSYVQTSRFSFNLSASKYLLINIKSDCFSGTKPMLGGVSNLSINRADTYPIGYEVVGSGKCKWQNRAFSVTIVGN